nr:MAG TPA: hypothetical protein [Caudoviricetes sp.]
MSRWETVPLINMNNARSIYSTAFRTDFLISAFWLVICTRFNWFRHINTPFPNMIINLKEGYNNMKMSERSKSREFIKRRFRNNSKF